MNTDTPPPYPTFREALWFWFKFGWVSFGGPAGQIAMMHEFLVKKKRWISNAKFLHALNYCMLLPGPEAQQLATYTGWMLHGTRGGLAAGILFLLPSAFILWALSVAYVTWGNLPMGQAVFEALKPAILAIIIGAVIKIGKKSLPTPLHWAVAVVAFVCIYFLNIPFPAIILGALVIGAIAYYFFPTDTISTKKMSPDKIDHEASYVINQQTPPKVQSFAVVRLIRQLTVVAVLWILPMLLVFWIGKGVDFWTNIAVFFTQAALVTFGGAYAVLPYVAQVSVAKFGWLTQMQVLDGLALGETTPGPLIMVLAFVGFMAGFNTFDGSLWAATFGLIATVYYTFLPSFLFIFVGAPIIEKTQTNAAVRAIIPFATAAVTGVVLNLCVYFATALIMPQVGNVMYWPLIWTVVSLVALRVFNIGMFVWIGVSVVVGLLRFWLL